MTIPHRFGLCSDQAKILIVGKVEDSNPITSKTHALPLSRMRVGESLFFHYAEMIPNKIMDARNLAKMYNRRHGEPFAFVKHAEPIKMLEIVRIK